MAWPSTAQQEAEFAEVFGDRLAVRTDEFYGFSANIMTPNLLGYVRADDGTVVEISRGTGFTGNPIYGVTFPRTDVDKVKGGKANPRSCMTYSLTDALAAVKGGK